MIEAVQAVEVPAIVGSDVVVRILTYYSSKIGDLS